jgi:hypothetical protein
MGVTTCELLISFDITIDQFCQITVLAGGVIVTRSRLAFATNPQRKPIRASG